MKRDVAMTHYPEIIVEGKDIREWYGLLENYKRTQELLAHPNVDNRKAALVFSELFHFAEARHKLTTKELHEKDAERKVIEEERQQSNDFQDALCNEFSLYVANTITAKEFARRAQELLIEDANK